jgi:hypothetical protein
MTRIDFNNSMPYSNIIGFFDISRDGIDIDTKGVLNSGVCGGFIEEIEFKASS